MIILIEKTRTFSSLWSGIAFDIIYCTVCLSVNCIRDYAKKSSQPKNNVSEEYLPIIGYLELQKLELVKQILDLGILIDMINTGATPQDFDDSSTVEQQAVRKKVAAGSGKYTGSVSGGNTQQSSPGLVMEDKSKDSDGDGVPDSEDKCDYERGTRATAGCSVQTYLKYAQAVAIPYQKQQEVYSSLKDLQFKKFVLQQGVGIPSQPEMGMSDSQTKLIQSICKTKYSDSLVSPLTKTTFMPLCQTFWSDMENSEILKKEPPIIKSDEK